MDKLAGMIAKDAGQIVDRVDLRQLKGKTVMIAGASGLIGTYFLACLKQIKTVKVVAIIQSRPKAYWSELADFKGVKVIRGDLTSLSFCQSLPQADIIIHAAGYGQPGRFLAEPVKTLKLNTLTTFLLFDKLKPKGKFLFISSSEIYSGLTGSNYRETQIGRTNTDHPRACYIEAKRTGEAICQAYRTKGVEAKICRLSLAYGPGTRQNDRRVLNQLIAKGLKGKIQLLDEGKAMRTYGYVADSVEIMWQILLKGRETIYNVGGESRISIVGLAKKIGKYLDAAVMIPGKTEGTIGAPDDVKMNLDKIKKEFSKTKFVSLDEGLKRTINWQKELWSDEA